jgi:cytochrome c
MFSGKKKTVISVILLGVCLVLAGCLALSPAGKGTGSGQTGSNQVASSSTPIALVSSSAATKDQLVAFVTEAVAYARANGREKALSEFSNPNGTFFRGQLYIYAYDFNGTTIAHPVNPEKIGVNRLNERDAKGNLFIEELRDTARNGSGFVQYYYVNPVHNNAIEPKLGYVMNVDDSWWLGSGIYGSLDQEI